MSVQVGSNGFSNIGRMFGRLNAPGLYGMQKSAAAGVIDDGAESVDRVSLSSQAPKPLPARLLEDALIVGNELANGGRLPLEKVEQLREDRVFAAVSALAAMGAGDAVEARALDFAWPGGLPAPTSEEMEAARRRLAQRLQNLELAGDPGAAQSGRAELWRKVAKRDLTAAPETAPA
jgi:hypothetical protein